MKRKPRKHEFLIFTTTPPDLRFIDSPWLEELERACTLKDQPELFGKHLETENRIWRQMHRRLREINCQEHFDLEMDGDRQYEPVESRGEDVEWLISSPFKCKIHAMRLELLARMQK